MADTTASFAVELKDETSGSAASAAEALKKLKFSIDDDTKALAAMQRAMKQLQGGTSVNVAAFKELQGRIDAQKSRIAGAQASYVELGGTFNAVRGGAARAGGEVAGLGERFKKIPGPVGDAARKLGDLKGALGGVSIGSIVAVGAVALLAGAVLAGIGKMFAFASSNADAIRSHATRSGGPVMSLAKQFEKMRKDFGKLFSGLNLGPFLRGMRQITSLFSQNTETGRALKALVEIIFQPMFDQVGAGAPLVKRFFQGMVIATLNITIAVLRLRNKFYDTFGNASLFGGLGTMNAALALGEVTMGALVVSVGLLVGVVGLLAGAFFGLGYGAAAAAGTMYDAFSELPDSLRYLGREFLRIGGSIIDGIVSGVTGGVSRAYNAIRGLGSGMAAALRTALGIHSPSRVFAGLGIQIPRGIEAGINQGAGSLDRTVADLVTADRRQVQEQAPGSSVAGTMTGASSSSAMSISFGDIYVTSGSNEPREQARAIREELADLLEGVGIGMGVLA